MFLITPVVNKKIVAEGQKIVGSRTISLIGHFSLEQLLNQLVNFSIKLGFALFILVITLKLTKIIKRLIKKSLVNHQVNVTLIPFLITLVDLAGKLVALVVAGSIIGITTTSFVALLGTAGLAIGLALQGSLANFAGGVLILLLRPFSVNDYIQVANHEGRVRAIQIFYTILTSIDNKTIVIPNGNVMKNIIVNYSHEKIRRVKVDVGVSYQTDLVKAKKILEQLARTNKLVLEEPGVSVYVTELAASAVILSLRVWCKRENYFKLKTELLEKIKTTFDQEKINIPYPHLKIDFHSE